MHRLMRFRSLAVSVLGALSLAVTLAGSPQTAGRPAGQPGADLSLTLTASRSHARVGQQVSYTAILTNPGPSDATFVDAAFSLPAGVQMVSMHCDQGVSPDGPFCEYSSLPAGRRVVSTLVVTLRASSSIRTRVVTMSASALFENPGDFDPNLANNRASVKTRIIGRLP